MATYRDPCVPRQRDGRQPACGHVLAATFARGRKSRAGRERAARRKRRISSARPNRSEDEDDLDLAPGETELVRQMCRRIDRRELLSVGDAGEERDEESRRVLLGPGEGALPDRGRQLVPRAHHQGDVEPEFAGKGSLDLLHELAWFFSLVVKTALPVCRSVATSL